MWRSVREPLYRSTLRQRFGYCAPISGDGPVIWVHSVSAGETIAAVPLVRRLIDKGYRVVVTTMTPTGRERVRALLGDDVHHFYAPWDLPGAVRRFFRRIDPSVLVIIDTELWPNMIHHARRRGTKVVLVNGRMSARSASGYKKISMITRPMMDAMTHVAVQSRAHGERFLALGLSAEKMSVAGSIKFDPELPADLDARCAALRDKIGDRLVFIAASTHPGEEEQVLSAFESARVACENLLLVLAPRHPHRADQVAELCNSRGLPVVRHSSGESCDSDTSVLLLDTMGELLCFYAVSDIAFVGGSLVPVGGHNLMEAAQVGVPVLMGPHLDNIEDIAAMFVEGDAMCLVDNEQDLSKNLARLCRDEGERTRLAANGERVVAANRGALDRVETLIEDLLK